MPWVVSEEKKKAKWQVFVTLFIKVCSSQVLSGRVERKNLLLLDSAELPPHKKGQSHRAWRMPAKAQPCEGKQGADTRTAGPHIEPWWPPSTLRRGQSWEALSQWLTVAQETQMFKAVQLTQAYPPVRLPLGRRATVISEVPGVPALPWLCLWRPVRHCTTLLIGFDLSFTKCSNTQLYQSGENVFVENSHWLWENDALCRKNRAEEGMEWAGDSGVRQKDRAHQAQLKTTLTSPG